jgi:hypothetical protein
MGAKGGKKVQPIPRAEQSGCGKAVLLFFSFVHGLRFWGRWGRVEHAGKRGKGGRAREDGGLFKMEEKTKTTHTAEARKEPACSHEHGARVRVGVTRAEARGRRVWKGETKKRQPKKGTKTRLRSTAAKMDVRVKTGSNRLDEGMGDKVMEKGMGSSSGGLGLIIVTALAFVFGFRRGSVSISLVVAVTPAVSGKKKKGPGEER